MALHTSQTPPGGYWIYVPAEQQPAAGQPGGAGNDAGNQSRDGATQGTGSTGTTADGQAAPGPATGDQGQPAQPPAAPTQPQPHTQPAQAAPAVTPPAPNQPTIGNPANQPAVLKESDILMMDIKDINANWDAVKKLMET